MAIKIRGKAELADGVVTVKALISHPMETGARKDKDGNVIPAHYVTTIKADVNGKVVFDAHWSTAISKDPFLSFRFRGAKAGDVVKITATDNKNDTGTVDVPVN